MALGEWIRDHGKGSDDEQYNSIYVDCAKCGKEIKLSDAMLGNSSIPHSVKNVFYCREHALEKDNQ